MFQKNYDRQYACKQIDAEVNRIERDYPWSWSRQDRLLIDAAEVQILLGNDKVALELLDKCFAGDSLIEVWEQAAEETEHYY